MNIISDEDFVFLDFKSGVNFSPKKYKNVFYPDKLYLVSEDKNLAGGNDVLVMWEGDERDVILRNGKTSVKNFLEFADKLKEITNAG